MQEWKCSVCGYRHGGEAPPDTCPVCGASKAVFDPSETAEETAASPPQHETPAAEVSMRWRCTICGYVHEGPAPPETCPVCGADRSAFEPLDPETEQEAVSTAATDAAAKEKTAWTPGVNPRKWADEQILLHHAHPISVHIPNGVLPIAVFFIGIGMLFDAPSFRLAAYFNLSMVFLALPLVLYTGFVEWRDRYRAAMTPVFRIKIACAGLTAVCVTILVLWRSFSPDAGGFFYLLLHLIALAAAGVAGHLGGKLVFGKRS